MKSEKAKEIIYSNYHFEINKDREIEYVYMDAVNKAVEVAEQEMMDRALKAHVRSCRSIAGGGRCFNKNEDSYRKPCDMLCDYVRDFKTMIK